MSPPRAVSAPSGDLCGSRALRAPQDQGECRGRLLLVTFLGEARKVTCRRATPDLLATGPARPRSALVAIQNTVARTNLRRNKIAPYEFTVRPAHPERVVATRPPCETQTPAPARWPGASAYTHVAAKGTRLSLRPLRRPTLFASRSPDHISARRRANHA